MNRAAIPALLVALVFLVGCEAEETPTSQADDTRSEPSTESKKKSPKQQLKTIDSASASGDYAVAQAGGTIEDPGTIRLRVTSKPRQKVSVTWTMVCAQESGAGNSDDQFEARTPVNKALKKPAKNVSDCTVAANAQLDQGGKVTVRIVG